jgi:Ni,Fe-hydrogenase III small subunit
MFGNAVSLRYAIKDASVNNWTALSIAIRNNLIADFPLVNKSFALWCASQLIQANGVGAVLPVDVFIPGCPPHPWSIIHGILLARARF